MSHYLFAFFLSATLAAQQSAIPACVGHIEISDGHLMRVEPNGAIILNDGRAVILEGVRLPQGVLDHAPQGLRDRALATLRLLAAARTLVLAANPPKEDQYDRVRAEVFGGDLWLQQTLLERGLARVSIGAGREECAAAFFASETRARNAKVGLWSFPAYRVRRPEELAHDVGTFQVVQGRIIAVRRRRGGIDLQFVGGARLGTYMARTDASFFRHRDPKNYVGRTVLMHGMVESAQRIMLADPYDMQIMAKTP